MLVRNTSHNRALARALGHQPARLGYLCITLCAHDTDNQTVRLIYLCFILCLILIVASLVQVIQNIDLLSTINFFTICKLLRYYWVTRQVIRLLFACVICSVCGVPVAYRSVYLLENYGYLMDDQPFIHVDVTVEYIVFCPHEGCTVSAVVNQKSSEHVSGLVLGLFNIAVTLRSKHSSEMLSQIYSGQEVLLKVTNIYVCTNGILSMRGRLRHHRGH